MTGMNVGVPSQPGSGSFCRALGSRGSWLKASAIRRHHKSSWQWTERPWWSSMRTRAVQRPARLSGLLNSEVARGENECRPSLQSSPQ